MEIYIAPQGKFLEIYIVPQATIFEIDNRTVVFLPVGDDPH